MSPEELEEIEQEDDEWADEMIRQIKEDHKVRQPKENQEKVPALTKGQQESGMLSGDLREIIVEDFIRLDHKHISSFQKHRSRMDMIMTRSSYNIHMLINTGSDIFR